MRRVHLFILKNSVDREYVIIEIMVGKDVLLFIFKGVDILLILIVT